MLLNGKPIIKHFWGETGKEGGNWLDSHIGNLRKNMKPGVEEFNSEAGNYLYFIKLFYKIFNILLGTITA